MGFMDEYRKLREAEIAKKASEASVGKVSSGNSTSSHGGSFNSIGSFESHMQNKVNVRSGIDAPLGNKYTPNLVNVSSRLTDRMTVSNKKKDEDKQDDHPVKGKVDSRLTVVNKKDKEEDKDKKWYQKGHFEDGWDFGDLTKTILGIDEDTASLKDLTINSAKRGYYNSLYGEETFKEIFGEENKKDVYKEKLESDEYQFAPGNELASGISGAFELVGQMARQYTNPRTLAMTGGAAGLAFAAGQAGPQALVPEEVLTVPAAALYGFKTGSAMSNLEIEAGHAYNEMIEMGVKEDIAKKIALGVGAGNAALEFAQLGNLEDAFKTTAKKEGTEAVWKLMLKELAARGIDVFTETVQEDAQELVTIGGVQAASYLDKGEFAYSAEEVGKRLWDTTKSSALSFGMMNVPATAKNTYSIIKDNKNASANQTVQNEHPVVEQTPKVEQEIKPEVEEVKPVVEETKVNPPKQENITESTTGQSDGETYFTMSYEQDGKVVGTVQYGEFEGKPNVKMIEVDPEYRRQGIGTKLLQELQKKYPDIEIDFGMATEDGSKLIESATYSVENTEVTQNTARIEEIKEKLAEYDKGIEEFIENDMDVPEDYAADYNELYDEMTALEEEIQGKKPTSTYVKTDEVQTPVEEIAPSPTASDIESYLDSYYSLDALYDRRDRIRKELEKAEMEGAEPSFISKVRNDLAEINKRIDSFVPTVSETENVETGVETGNNNPQLEQMIAQRDSLQETLMDRYNQGLYNEETERLANEWSRLNYQIESMNAEQSSADTDAPIAEESDAPADAPVQQSEEKPKFVPNIEKSTPAQSIFKTRALDVESLPNHAKEKVKGKYKALERATDAATTLLMHGNDTLRPVHEIFEDISKVGDVEDFNSYIYHKLNPERIAQDKDVHRGVSAETSQEYVKHLAENNSEFEKYAQEIYAWCDYLLNLQVASKRITQETADRWKTMYPSFAPIRRSGFTDDLKIAEMLGLVLENQGNILETDFAEEVVEAIEKTDPLSKEKKTTGGKKPILPLQDTLAERVVQVHWAAALNSDLFDVADTKTTSKPEHALYVDDVLQYVDNFENPFTDKDFTFDKRNDNHMRSRFSKEELSRLTKETNELIDVFNSGNFTSEHRAKLNEDYVLHDLQVVRNKMESLNKWLDRINGELAHDKAELSELKQKEEDLLVSHYTFTSSSVDRLQSEYSNRIKVLEARVEAGENKLRNATHYVKEQTGRYSYSDKLDWKKKTEHTYSLKELETAYVGMLSFDKPKSSQPVSEFSSGTTFIDSNTQYDGDQIAPVPFAEEETYVEESPIVEYDEPKFTNPKDAKFDLDGNDKKLGKTSMFMDHFVDKGAIFEKLGRETNNDELAAKWDFIRKTYNATQHMIGKGVDGIKSVNKVFTDVDKLGIAEEFDDYLRLMAHWDGMTVKMRYGFPKNRAFLNTDLEAYKAKDQARELEERFPQFAELADDIYQNMAHLRSEMVDAGLMTQKDADFIAEVYPHFVPVRYNQDGTKISVFDSIATQMMNVKRACATNKFSGELLGTLNTAVPLEGIDSYDILSRFAGSPNLFELGEFGNYPTYTFYDNGRKVNYAVSIQMKEALTKSHPGLNARISVLAGANDLFRAVTTEYNVPFHASNFIRDAKSVLLNSQHAAKTYMNYPRALKEIVTKGKYYQEYLENGGGSNTYFDTKKRVFTSSKKTLRDFPPLALISKGGNVIESLPRLSEFIVDREMGKSIEKSMLDASRVTTNFGAGGDVTKFIDRNGATFLNASVQGFAQTVRNFQDAKAKGLMGYGVLGAKLMLMGLSHALLDEIVWGDDEDYQNLPDYIKESYDIVGKTNSGRFIRIPKDRTQACIDNAYDQIKDALTGDDEIDLLEFGRIFVANLAPNNFLDDNIFAPIRQVRNNKAWYGDDLVPSRLQDLPESEQFDDKTDAISRYLGEKFDYSPYKINYLMNSYGGGLADVVLPFLTPRAESGSDSILGKVLNPFRDKFTTDPVLNNRVTDDFYAKVDELQAVANSEDATEEDKLIASYMLSESSEISDLWEKRREIQSSDLPDSTKFERMREVKEEINNRMFDALDSYDNVKITGKYATIDGHRFNKDDSGKWWELKPKKADGTDNGYYKNEQEHLNVLGITPEQYWNNQEYYHEQYNMAVYRPGEYALTEVFGGYDDYLRITGDWSDLVTGKNDSGQWNTTVNKKTVGNIIYGLDIPEIEKHILYKSIYNYTDTHNRKILEYLDSRDDINWNEMKKIVIELGFTVDENDNIRW